MIGRPVARAARPGLIRTAGLGAQRPAGLSQQGLLDDAESAAAQAKLRAG